MDILIALLVLNIMIIAHELGHFIFAKRNGIDVEEFAIGFGPTLLQKKWRGTNWVIKLFPLGGYNGLKGETHEAAGPGNFATAAKRHKLQVLFAGSFMNILVSILAFYISLGLTGWKVPVPVSFTPIGGEIVPIDQPHPIVVAYAKDSPAERMQVELPFYLVSVNGKEVSTGLQVIDYIENSSSKTIELGIRKGVDEYSKTVEKSEDNRIGIVMEEYPVQISYAESVFNKVFSGVSHTINTIGLSGKVIGDVLQYSIKNRDAEPLGYVFAGPAAVVAAVGSVVENSQTVLADLANMTGLIGVSLAVFNMLPFPGLDGWHIMLVVYEKIRGRKPNQKLTETLSAWGILLLLGLGILIIIKDIYVFFLK